jgi:hypothetical protein
MKINFLIQGICILMLGWSMSGCSEKYDKEIEKDFYVNKSSLKMYYGDKIQLAASPASGEFAWSSEDPDIATVTAGLVEAVGVGTTNILVSQDNIIKEIPVTITVPTVDKVTGMPGNRRVALELAISNDRVKSVKVTRLDNSESQETEINYQSGTITVYYNGLSEGSYQFRVVCLDRSGKESVPVDIAVKAYGDIYQSTLVNREINIVSKFGNGLTVSWKNQSGNWIKFFYNNEAGLPVSKILPVNAHSSHLADYGSGTLSYTTLFLPEITAVDTFSVAQASYTGTITDYTTYLTASPAVSYAKPGDFDLGGEGVGFHDSDATHSGAAGATYRKDRGDTQSDAVDIEAVAGNTGANSAGEWLMYTVYVKDEGNYEIDWYVSVNNANGGSCRIEADGVSSSVYQMVNNANWSAWRYYCELNGVNPPVFHLTAGKHKIMFYFNSSGFNYNGLRFTCKP